MIRKFKILVIGHQLKNQVIAKYPDIVDESQLNGNADELVKAGFVEEVNEDESFDLGKMSKNELINFAKLNNYTVTETASKKDILAELDILIKNEAVTGEKIVE